MATLKHELWVDPKGLETFCLAGPMGEDARKLLPRGSKLVWTVNASSHFEAMTKYHEHMKWPPYTTDQESDHKPYPDEWLKIQQARSK